MLPLACKSVKLFLEALYADIQKASMKYKNIEIIKTIKVKNAKHNTTFTDAGILYSNKLETELEGCKYD